jgi:hypothetical protein
MAVEETAGWKEVKRVLWLFRGSAVLLALPIGVYKW